MKNLQSNEKHLADKLQHVPVPDVDQSWEQMRKLLDRDMPEPVGGAWGGNRKWWWMGITAGIIMLAAWLTQPFNQLEREAGKNIADKNVPSVKTPSSNANDNSSTKDDKSKAAENLAGNTKTSDTKNDEDRKDAGNKDVNTTSDPDAAVSNNATVTPDTKEAKADKNTDGQFSPANKGKANEFTQRSTKDDTKIVIPGNQKNDVSATGLSKQQNRPGGSFIKRGKQTKTGFASNDRKTINDGYTKNKSANKNTGNSNAADDQIISHATSSMVTSNEKVSSTENEAEAEAVTVNTELIRENQLSNPSDVFSSLENTQPANTIIAGKTDKDFVREMRKKSMKDDTRKISRSSMRGNFGDNERNITFAAGLALPQSLAISGQQSSSYNINGKSNRLTDYLPAPFFQYHVNNKLFLQTEFHFQSPQYTERLLFSRNTNTNANTRFESNIYLEKLYYFNIPFNVYYSPARNFFIGSGLQYSSLLSGVASFEEKRTEGQNVLSYQSITRRFKDDSVAAVFSPSEWRYQFDANYYFKRFTLGLRYNQAMKDFISLPASGSLPLIEQRNKSFLLYLRFNIWEERKKVAD